MTKNLLLSYVFSQRNCTLKRLGIQHETEREREVEEGRERERGGREKIETDEERGAGGVRELEMRKKEWRGKLEVKNA